MVTYFGNPCSPAVRKAMSDKMIGFIDTPAQQNIRHDRDLIWCADNGCFGSGYPGDAKWLKWLEKHRSDQDYCAFATAPDVVGDGVESLKRSTPLLPKIRELGYAAALVGQDGMEDLEIPWDDFDVLFIGGSTEWKLGLGARSLVRQAWDLNKGIHMGRVNSLRRFRYAMAIGCDSVDGTYLKFGPDINLPKLLKWVETMEKEYPGRGFKYTEEES